MALRNILLEDDLTLRKKAREVTNFDTRLHQLLDDMAATMVENNGVGLAAPQVGILRQIVTIDVGEGLVEFINPQIIETEGEQTGLEGCLSMPGEMGIVTRPKKVKVEFFDRHGKKQTLEAEDMFARCICHETDHLKGILYRDIAEKMLTQEELEEYLSKEDDDEE